MFPISQYKRRMELDFSLLVSYSVSLAFTASIVINL